MNPITSEPGVVELTRDEGRKMLDERTRRELGMTLEEFEAAYDAGTLDLDRSDVIGKIRCNSGQTISETGFGALSSAYQRGSPVRGGLRLIR